MKLFISGQKDFVKKTLSPTMQRLKNILDKSRDGEIFATGQLVGILGVSRKTICEGDVYRIFNKYTCRVKNQRYWGKPNTIKQLIKETK